MSKKKQQKKKVAKKTTSSSKRAKSTKSVKKSAKGKKPVKRVAAKAKSKPKAKKLSGKNRRQFRRRPTSNLWVTEQSGDYHFVLPAGDISEGGIYLKGRLKTGREDSLLTIHMGKLGSLQVTAKPVYDRLTKGSYGTGYQFARLVPAQTRTLKSFLRNLD